MDRHHRCCSHRGAPPLRVIAALALVLAAGGCSDGPAGPSEEQVVYVAGETYYGAHGYIEYIAGDVPIVIGAPHGGYLTPASIPDRTWGTTGRDRNTQELVRRIAGAFHDRTDRHLHVVINRLARIKLDANREIVEAAQGSAEAEQSWYDWHRFIDAAGDSISVRWGSGLYIDLHGHGHEIQRLELGYLLTDGELSLTDQQLIDQGLVLESSVKALALSVGVPEFPALLRGEHSLGSLMVARGFAAVPTMWTPSPAGAPYFAGGYNTRRHGSRDGGTVSSVQIECNYTGVRDTEVDRDALASALVSSLEVFFESWYGFTYTGEPLPAWNAARYATALPAP